MRARPASAPDARPPKPRITLLFERLLGAYVVLYALQALYSHGMGFPRALQNEAFFYVPFAILLARLRDIEWDRRLLLLSLKTTAVLAVIFSLIGFEEETTKHLLISSKLVTSNQLHRVLHGQLGLLRPQHLRSLSRARDAVADRRGAL